MAGIFGYQGKLGIGTATPVTNRFNFASEDLVLHEEFVDVNKLRGVRSHSSVPVRQGIRRVTGSLHLQPTAVELANLLQWVMGGTPTGTGTITYPLADVIYPTTGMYVVIDRGAGVFTYSGCSVNRATFHCSQGEPLNADLELVGIDETVAAAGTFPVLNLDLTTQPFVFMDMVLSVNGSTSFCRNFELVVDNDLEKERFFNSETVTAIYAKDRHVTITHSLPYGDNPLDYGLGVAGVSVTLTFTNGTAVLEFNMQNVKYPRRSPHVDGREEVMLPLQGTAYRVGVPTAVGVADPGLELITTLAS